MPEINVILGDMAYQLGLGNQNVVLRIAGNWGGSNAAKLGGVFKKALKHLRGPLFLNLSGCTQIDSGAVELLANQKTLYEAHSAEIVLVEVPQKILAVLNGAGISGLFSVQTTIQEATGKPA